MKLPKTIKLSISMTSDEAARLLKKVLKYLRALKG